METFKRNQVEWALWSSFVHRPPNPGEPPQVFRTRIKRLLDLDRATPIPPRSNSLQRHAFSEGHSEGHGRDVSFSVFDAVCLAIGLDLLDTGFKQSEVVFLLQHLRLQLGEQYERMQLYPPAPRKYIAAEDLPGCPTYEMNGLTLADPRIFMTLNKVELREIYTNPPNPMILQPRFYYGIEQLTKELDRLNYSERKVLVMEIAEISVLLESDLRQAPLVRRGRPSLAGGR